MDKELNEYVLPFDGVTFLFDPAYQVNLKECASDLEIRNERIAAHVAQKYNLIYHQGEAISLLGPEITEELRQARTEIGEWMPVGKIQWFAEPANEHFFIFKSWEKKV